jgi:RES domain-containing protein
METAWCEAQQGFAFKAQPLTVCAYEVDCEDVADLTDPATVAKLGVSISDLSCPWEDLASRKLMPPSWELARDLIARGTAAIIVPSFAPGATSADRNIVFWRWSATLPHRLVVIDDETRLPRDDKSWM